MIITFQIPACRTGKLKSGGYIMDLGKKDEDRKKGGIMLGAIFTV